MQFSSHFLQFIPLHLSRSPTNSVSSLHKLIISFIFRFSDFNRKNLRPNTDHKKKGKESKQLLFWASIKLDYLSIGVPDCKVKDGNRDRFLIWLCLEESI